MLAVEGSSDDLRRRDHKFLDLQRFSDRERAHTYTGREPASVSLRVSKPEADHCGDWCMKVLACCNACHFSCAENSSSCRNLQLSTALVVRTYGSGFRVYEGVFFRRVPWDGAYRGISGVYKRFGSLS